MDHRQNISIVCLPITLQFYWKITSQKFMTRKKPFYLLKSSDLNSQIYNQKIGNLSLRNWSMTLEMKIKERNLLMGWKKPFRENLILLLVVGSWKKLVELFQDWKGNDPIILFLFNRIFIISFWFNRYHINWLTTLKHWNKVR